MTNAQRRAAASRMAENNLLSTPQASQMFCPHQSGAYYLANVDTVASTIKLFSKDIKPPVYTYNITTVFFLNRIQRRVNGSGLMAKKINLHAGTRMAGVLATRNYMTFVKVPRLRFSRRWSKMVTG